ncbi:hypothetical protein ERO13_D06G138900v2 [Gossypium hirsutum]|uniref:Precursor of CEP14 n=5 Tax=Gossypium TaxID=3633 RepID=A0A1U8IYP9_GOSHI|nr:precursor of CEP14-like [Gossypium hirsutum]KAB2025616.1 hypothetical protein ES319_D06G162600v1 [Gossypium barbadense]TYG65280.1 hypothetical protein ES288_D06G173600v1 [Gossypium darwinii]TYH67248.1 hypothetical protein ES332_D06G176000v1 [Gossypium tomentosum]TYI77755.1 hypothetical protein E1A91_D06G164200v1 [Gossypium mustelinum]KAG4142593.1 hypothetical protein ERO13_D06G138900v2 [Gossypium hirsutum]
MARFSSLVLILLVVFAASFMPQMESRKLLMNTAESNGNLPPLFASLVLNALPKGAVPSASATSKKDHSTTLGNEKLFARHLAGIDRILQSVPSPGAGH